MNPTLRTALINNIKIDQKIEIIKKDEIANFREIIKKCEENNQCHFCNAKTRKKCYCSDCRYEATGKYSSDYKIRNQHSSYNAYHQTKIPIEEYAYNVKNIYYLNTDHYENQKLLKIYEDEIYKEAHRVMNKYDLNPIETTLSQDKYIEACKKDSSMIWLPEGKPIFNADPMFPIHDNDQAYADEIKMSLEDYIELRYALSHRESLGQLDLDKFVCETVLLTGRPSDKKLRYVNQHLDSINLIYAEKINMNLDEYNALPLALPLREPLGKVSDLKGYFIDLNNKIIENYYALSLQEPLGTGDLK